MPKKLLNVNFASYPNGTYKVNLGSNSSDNVPVTNIWQVSDEHPLGQVGACITAPDSSAGLGTLPQTYLYKELEYCGYGSRIALLKASGQIGIHMYLNGKPVDDDNNPQPYVVFEDSGYFVPQLVYHMADGTSLGPVYTNLYYAGGDHYAVMCAGKIYTDGTTEVQRIILRPHYILGVPSKKRYEWKCVGTQTTSNPVINSAMLDDLIDYLPISPEGEFMDDGEGFFDATSDTIAFPDLPSINPLQTGMCAMYEMPADNLRALSQYLWTTDFWDTIKKMFNDPMEAIMNLAIIPVEYTGLVSSTIKIGNVITTVSGNAVTNPYKIIDFGTINLLEYWGNFADYSPYTKLSIFLPYVGVQMISVDDVMNGAIQLKAYCDCLTGSIQYMLYSVQNNHRGHNHASVLYTWGGNMQYQVPLTASNFSSVVSSLISTAGTIAGGVVAGVATEGAAAPIAVGTIASSIGSISKAKTQIQRGGGLGGAVGLFGVQTPYLILERPEEIYPVNYDHTVGIPNETTDYLKNYTGFVKIKGCHIEIDNATDNEMKEIETLLKEGVVV